MIRLLTFLSMLASFIACSKQDNLEPVHFIDPAPALAAQHYAPKGEKQLPPAVDLSEGLDRLQGQLEWVQHRLPKETNQ